MIFANLRDYYEVLQSFGANSTSLIRLMAYKHKEEHFKISILFCKSEIFSTKNIITIKVQPRVPYQEKKSRQKN